MHSSNQYLKRWHFDRYVLDIGHYCSSSGSDMTLATLGRNGDVVVEGSVISKI
jgi:hypothetical protein